MGKSTDEIRARFDELDIKWWPSSEPGHESVTTYWLVDGIKWVAFEDEDNTLWLNCISVLELTPAQAIAATVGNRDAEYVLRQLVAQLGDAADFHFANKYVDCIVDEYAGKLAKVGAGTCKRVYHPNRITKTCTCSNCGYGASDERWAYCPKCGHKYVHGEVEERWKRVGRKVAE